MMILSLGSNLLIAAGIIGALGLVFGVLIAFFAKVFYVEEDTRIEEVTSMLPGINCGLCGHPGCNGLATAIIEKGATVDLCRPIKPAQKEVIREYLRNLEANETAIDKA